MPKLSKKPCKQGKTPTGKNGRCVKAKTCKDGKVPEGKNGRCVFPKGHVRTKRVKKIVKSPTPTPIKQSCVLEKVWITVPSLRYNNKKDEQIFKKYKGEFVIDTITISCNGIKFQFIKDEQHETREISIVPIKGNEYVDDKPVDEILELLHANHITKDALLNYKITSDMIEEYDVGTNPKGILSITPNDNGNHSNTENLNEIMKKDHYSGLYYNNIDKMDKDVIEKAIKSEITKFINHFKIK